MVLFFQHLKNVVHFLLISVNSGEIFGAILIVVFFSSLSLSLLIGHCFSLAACKIHFFVFSFQV